MNTATILGVGDVGPLHEPIARYGEDSVSLAVALFVYATGYKGLRQPEIFRYDRPATSDRTETSHDGQPTGPAAPWRAGSAAADT